MFVLVIAHNAASDWRAIVAIDAALHGITGAHVNAVLLKLRPAEARYVALHASFPPSGICKFVFPPDQDHDRSRACVVDVSGRGRPCAVVLH